jgi:predicted AAA+ superfamily ATPase
MDSLKNELSRFNPWWDGDFPGKFVQRPIYMDFFKKNLSNKDIIILTGLRRVGKTSLLKMFIKSLLDEVKKERIFYASLDSITLEKYSIAELLNEYRKLHKISLREKIYLFFDEITYRKNISLELKNLYDAENVKLFVSSSSATLLQEKNAYLTGRSRVLEIFPLDFNEYLIFKKIRIKKSESYLTESYFEDFMQSGGMPEYVLTNDVSYLDNLIDSILYKDIAVFYGVRDLTLLKDFFRLLMERAGKQLSIGKVSKVLNISADTVRRYLDYFQRTYLIFAIERCGKLNERLKAPKKIFAIDTGLKSYVSGFRDKGSLFENLVFLKIKKYRPCYVYQNGIEIDFYFNEKLLEAKYFGELNTKQKKLFDSFPAKEKKIIDSISGYLKLK